MRDPVVVWEWDVDAFHRRVLDLESQGYVARRETYEVKADVNPETGIVVHLHTIEMVPSDEPAGLNREGSAISFSTTLSSRPERV